MALIFFYTGLKIIGPVKASMLLNIEPIFTIVLASVMLGEQLSGRQFGGAALVIMGIIMVNHKSGRNEQ
jgi:drug/metabolite transporter (DMT)-like permease